jgi:hypothetical protein
VDLNAMELYLETMLKDSITVYKKRQSFGQQDSLDARFDMLAKVYGGTAFLCCAAGREEKRREA